MDASIFTLEKPVVYQIVRISPAQIDTPDFADIKMSVGSRKDAPASILLRKTLLQVQNVK